MATLGNISSLNAGATAHINVDAEQPKPEQPVAAPQQQEPTTLPADGLVLAEATAFRTVSNKFLSHTAGLVSNITKPPFSPCSRGGVLGTVLAAPLLVQSLL